MNNQTNREKPKTSVSVLQSIAVLLLLVFISGCASYAARKRLEGVAKGWCEMIRASQVIPVYPLTQDLMVGDVFLTQTTINDQASEYNRRGFLALDDYQIRLPYTNFSQIYFDGYWKDGFGGTNTPHPVPVFTNIGAISNVQPLLLTTAPLPRAAFPTYSVQAQSGYGFNAAFPIQGIPVALSYLNSQQVNASITIADARTYAGDPGQLYALLLAWSQNPATRAQLAQAASNVAPTKVFLRVVSRVYYARAVDVFLERAGSQGASGKAGTIGAVSLAASNGTNNIADYTNVLNTLTAAATTAASVISNATQIGGAVKFVSASSSTVGLSQSFDSLLAIGYLGFDVQVDTNGNIGYPIPTFQHIMGKIPKAAAKVHGVEFGADANSAKIRAWLNLPATPSHEELLRQFLGPSWLEQNPLPYVLNAKDYSAIRSLIVARFNITM